jgi:outer membrane protein assembly factor BamB
MPRGLEVESHDDKWTAHVDRTFENVEELFIIYFEWYLWDCAAGDLTGDGKAEIVGASEDATLRVVDGKNKELWRKEFHRAVFFCKIVDIDKDGMNEVICGGVDGSLFVYEKDGNLKWEFPIEEKAEEDEEELMRRKRFWVYDATVADVTGDGNLEIIVVSRDKTLRVINSKGKELWQTKFRRYVRHCNFGDINGDGKLEVLGSDTDQFLKVFNNEGKQLWEFQFELKPPDPMIEVRSDVQIATGDLNKDGKEEVVAGSEDAYLRVFNGEGKESWNYKFEGAVHAITIADLTQDGNLEVIVGAEAELGPEGKATESTKNLIVFDGSGKILWHTKFDGAVF